MVLKEVKLSGLGSYPHAARSRGPDRKRKSVSGVNRGLILRRTGQVRWAGTQSLIQLHTYTRQLESKKQNWNENLRLLWSTPVPGCLDWWWACSRTSLASTGRASVKIKTNVLNLNCVLYCIIQNSGCFFYLGRRFWKVDLWFKISGGAHSVLFSLCVLLLLHLVDVTDRLDTVGIMRLKR